MSVAAARADLAATLGDTGYKVYAYDSPKIVSGSIIIDEPESGLLEYGDVLSQPLLMRVTFRVWLWQDMKNMATATKKLDTMLEAAVMNLGDWTLTDLRSHFRTQLQEGGPVYLASVLSVTNYTVIGETN